MRTDRGDTEQQSILRPNVILKLATKRRPRPPPVCDCPVDHPPTPKSRLSTAIVGRKAPFKPSVSTELEALAYSSVPQAVLFPSIPQPSVADSGPPAAPQETAAKQCGSRRSFKPPPRGKKITYRKAKGKYMCVPRNAPDEVGPDDVTADDVMVNAAAQSHNVEPWEESEHSQATPMTATPTPLRDTNDSIVLSTDAPAATQTFAPGRNTGEQAPLHDDLLDEPVVAQRTTPVLELPSQYSSTLIAAANAAFHTVAAPNTGISKARTPESRKRSAGVPDDQPAAKMPRTTDSTSSAASRRHSAIKAEPDEDGPDLVEVPNSDKTNLERRLEEELARKQRERRLLQLEGEIEDVRGQLRAERERKRRALVETEIIEID